MRPGGGIKSLSTWLCSSRRVIRPRSSLQRAMLRPRIPRYAAPGHVPIPGDDELDISTSRQSCILVHHTRKVHHHTHGAHHIHSSSRLDTTDVTNVVIAGSDATRVSCLVLFWYSVRCHQFSASFPPSHWRVCLTLPVHHITVCISSTSAKLATHTPITIATMSDIATAQQPAPQRKRDIAYEYM